MMLFSREKEAYACTKIKLKSKIKYFFKSTFYVMNCGMLLTINY